MKDSISFITIFIDGCKNIFHVAYNNHSFNQAQDPGICKGPGIGDAVIEPDAIWLDFEDFIFLLPRLSILWVFYNYLFIFRYWSLFAHANLVLYLNRVVSTVSWPSFVSMDLKSTKTRSTLQWLLFLAFVEKWSLRTHRLSHVLSPFLLCWNMKINL